MPNIYWLLLAAQNAAHALYTWFLYCNFTQHKFPHTSTTYPNTHTYDYQNGTRHNNNNTAQQNWELLSV